MLLFFVGTIYEHDKGSVEGKISDKCITLLLGSNQESHGKKCVVTKECIEWETKPHTAGYILTHQYLYFLVGNYVGEYIWKPGWPVGKNLWDLKCLNLVKQG